MNNELIGEINSLYDNHISLIKEYNNICHINNQLTKENESLKQFQHNIVSKIGDTSLDNLYNVIINNDKLGKINKLDHKDLISKASSIMNKIKQILEFTSHQEQAREIRKNVNINKNLFSPLKNDNFLIQLDLLVNKLNLIDSKKIKEIDYFFKECKIILSETNFNNLLNCLSNNKSKKEYINDIFNSIHFNAYLTNRLYKIIE